MSHADASQIAVKVLEAVARAVVLGMALTLLTAWAMRMMGMTRAAARYTVWVLTLVGVAALPFIELTRISWPAAVQTPATRWTGTGSPAASTGQELVQPVPMPAASVASSPQQPVLRIEVAQDALEVMLAFYLLTLAFLSARLLFHYWRLRRLRSRTQPALPELTDRLQLWLAHCPTNRPVQLRLSDSARTPMALGFRGPMIVVPKRTVLELTEQEFDQLGIHELAHIRRYDDWMKLFERLAQAFFFFNPAVHWIVRRLDLERELACDEEAASAMGDGKPLARCLAKLVDLQAGTRGFALASGAIFRKRQIFQRVERLMDNGRNSGVATSPVTIVLASLAVIGILTQVSQSSAVIALTSGGYRLEQTHSWPDRSLGVRRDGEIRFTDDERGIASMDPGARLRVEERRGGVRREIEANADGAGVPKLRYLVNGNERAFDETGRAWVAAVLPVVIREFAWDVPSRVARIHSRDGAAGVFTEIARIENSHSRRLYLNELMTMGKLSEDEWRRAATFAARLGSDHEKAELLVERAAAFAKDGLRASYFNVVDTIGSDHERKRVLTEIIAVDGRNEETRRRVADAIRRMGSDHEKKEVLSMFADSAEGLDARLLKAAQGMGSDHEKAAVLEEAAGHYKGDSQFRRAFFDTVNGMRSDHEKQKVLKHLMQVPDLPAETLESIAQVVERMGSDSAKAEILRELAKRHEGEALFRAVNAIGSTSERKQVLLDVLKRDSSPELIARVIESAKQIGSDNEKADVLAAVARRLKGQKPPAAFEQALNTIGSDSDYRRVTSELLKTDR